MFVETNWAPAASPSDCFIGWRTIDDEEDDDEDESEEDDESESSSSSSYSERAVASSVGSSVPSCFLAARFCDSFVVWRHTYGKNKQHKIYTTGIVWVGWAKANAHGVPKLVQC